jgi:LPS-assembly protein
MRPPGHGTRHGWDLPPAVPLGAPAAKPALRRPERRRRRRALLRELASWRTALSGAAALLAVALAFQPTLPEAQSGLGGLGSSASSNEPVTFTAEEVEYDQNAETVTARGRVEAWQGERVLRAETFTYNRGTGIAIAEGNVVLIEPNGQVLFTDRAELSQGMRDAVLEGLRGHLTGNARVAAAGARRTNGDITDLARVVYSPCDLCAENPERAPLWQLRARIASLHATEQRVRYRDAAVQFAGLPLLYTPYLSHASPDAPRASGFLSPTFGNTKTLGLFTETPYYWAIDNQSDLRINPTFSTKQAPNLSGIYRRRFNTGEVAVEGSVGALTGGTIDPQADGLGGHIFSSGRFAIDENWRAGFGLNRASSRDYLRAYRYESPQFLTTSAWLEGFWGTEGYARLDSRLYQALTSTGDTGTIPFVLPYGYGEYAFRPDDWGGRLTIDGGAFGIYRNTGTDTRRTAARVGYELPLMGAVGDVITLRGRLDGMAGWVNGLELAPSYGNASADGLWSHANARAAVDWRLPLLRDAGEWGANLIEPRVQFVTGPNQGAQGDFPNEDSLDLEFTDATLFALNRYPGRDRQEGGTRVDYALRSAWLFPNGGQLEGLVGQSYRFHEDASFPTGSGLENHASDYVARARLAPVPWFEVVGRTRLDAVSGQPRIWDGSGTIYGGGAALTAGYLTTPAEPGVSSTKREEVSAGASLQLTDTWRLGGFARYDLQRDRLVAAQLAVVYEDECLVFETRFIRNKAEDPTTGREYTSGTVLLFRLTLKTIGGLSVRAL